LSRPRRAGLAVCLADMVTLLVWWRETGAASSPGVTIALLPLFALAIVLMIRLSRPQVAPGDTTSDGASQAGSSGEPRRPRRLADLPRQQRRAAIVVFACTAALFLLLVPIMVLAMVQGESFWQAAPLLVILALMLSGAVFVWRQLR
jgi:hypothetical protein